MDSSQGNSTVNLLPDEARAILSSWRGGSVRCNGIERLQGGMCYAVFRVTFDEAPHNAVVKIDAQPSSTGFGREHANLEFLHEHTRFPAPRVYRVDSSRSEVPFCFLLLENLEGINLKAAQLAPEAQAQIDRELADVLLELHSHTRATFGTVDDVSGVPCWTDVFLPKLAELRRDMEGQLPGNVLRDLDRALAKAESCLRDFGQPALVHGDIWAGNILVAQERGLWHLSGMVDLPALQYADVEYELAHVEALKTVTPALLERYQQRRPLRPGYEVRKLFYWLHTYMLHVWLFEQDQYRQMVGRTASRFEQDRYRQMVARTARRIARL